MKRILMLLVFGLVIFRVAYHRVYTLSNGAMVGELGSMKYLLNKDGYRISEGYHEIYPMDDGRYRAELGAGKYILRDDGRKECGAEGGPR